MSLSTDKFFYRALKADTAIMKAIGGRIFNPARTTADEKEDRIPYITITLDEVDNQSETKDDVEGMTDQVVITILCVAKDREALADMTEAVRKQCREYLYAMEESDEDGAELTPLDWHFRASGVEYDKDKPCVYQALYYECDTNR